MVKKSARTRFRALDHPNLIAVISVAAVIVAGLLLFQLFTPEKFTSVPDDISSRNLNIQAEANLKKDPSICNRIFGGINGAQSGRGDSFGRRPQTQTEAINSCKKAAQD